MNILNNDIFEKLENVSFAQKHISVPCSHRGHGPGARRVITSVVGRHNVYPIEIHNIVCSFYSFYTELHVCFFFI